MIDDFYQLSKGLPIGFLSHSHTRSYYYYVQIIILPYADFLSRPGLFENSRCCSIDVFSLSTSNLIVRYKVFVNNQIFVFYNFRGKIIFWKDKI